jgi:hypothetical protein
MFDNLFALWGTAGTAFAVGATLVAGALALAALEGPHSTRRKPTGSRSP